MNAIAPVWDGNETWLVLGGGGLLAAFPLAYAIILPALYAPLIAMLLGLVFRGVAFEFRWRDPGHRTSGTARLLRRLAGRDLRAGHHARRAAAGHQVERPRLCRRLVGLADAVQPADRRQPGRRLCPARRDLADLEDRRRRCNARARRLARLLLPAPARRDRRGQPRDAVRRAAIFPALVRIARACSCAVPMPLSRRRRPDRSGGASRARRDWLPFVRRSRCSRLTMAGLAHLDLAGRDPRPRHDLAGGGAACEPALHAGRRRWSWSR